MLIGATGKLATDRAVLARPRYRDTEDAVHWLKSQDAVVAIGPWGVGTLDSKERWAVDSATESWLALSGHLYHDVEISRDTRPGGIANLLLS